MAAHPLRVMGFQALFEDNPAVAIIAAQMADVLRDKSLDVALLGAQPMEPMLELIGTLRAFRPDLRVIVMGDGAEDGEIERIIGAGARGYLPQSATEAEILMALREVFEGSVWAPRRILSRLIDQVGRPAPAESAASKAAAAKGSFTEREMQVLELLATGANNREIGKALAIEERTVKSHLGSLMRKTGVQNRISLIMHAMNNDLLRKKK
ncbi:MAG: response regulator transcription factor [Acidobacteriaceae bacterium]